MTSVHIIDGSSPIIGPSTRSPQLPPRFPSWANFQAVQRLFSWSPLRVTEAGNRPRFCSHPPRRPPPPLPLEICTRNGDHGDGADAGSLFEREEGAPAVASTAPTRSVPAVASIARPAGTQYVTRTKRATFTVVLCSTSWHDSREPPSSRATSRGAGSSRAGAGGEIIIIVQLSTRPHLDFKCSCVAGESMPGA